MDRGGSPTAPRETGEARQREQRLRALSAGEERIARQGVLARPPSSEQGSSALPGNGQVSLQNSFGGVLVQRSVVHTAQQSRCHGVTGDLAREPKRRGDTPQGLAESARFFKESILARGWSPSGSGRAKRRRSRRTTAAKSWDRRGAGRLLPSRKRGLEGACRVTGRGKAPRIVEAACVSRAGRGGGLGDLRRITIARQAPGFESRGATGVSEARSSREAALRIEVQKQGMRTPRAISGRPAEAPATS